MYIRACVLKLYFICTSVNKKTGASSGAGAAAGYRNFQSAGAAACYRRLLKGGLGTGNWHFFLGAGASWNPRQVAPGPGVCSVYRAPH